MDAEQERIRGYLQSQAAKLSIAELTEKIRADMEQVHAALEAAPTDCFTERPVQDDWSPNEVAAHLTATSKSVADGICAVLDHGAQPERVPDRMQGTDTVYDAAGWWKQLKDDREALFARVARAKGDEYPEITWEHPMFGQLNWREWLLFTRLHDIDHARQLQKTTEALAAAQQ